MEVQTEMDTYTVNIPAVLTKDVSGQFDLIIILTKAMQSEKCYSIYKKLIQFTKIQQY